MRKKVKKWNMRNAYAYLIDLIKIKNPIKLPKLSRRRHNE